MMNLFGGLMMFLPHSMIKAGRELDDGYTLIPLTLDKGQGTNSTIKINIY